MIALKGGQRDQAVSLLKEAVQIEDSMRPPNGAADPIKPSHELLGEALLEVGQPAEAAHGLRRVPAAHAESRALADGRRACPRGCGSQGSRRGALQGAEIVLEGRGDRRADDRSTIEEDR